MLKKYRGVLFLLLFFAAAVGLFAFLNRGSQGFEEKYEGVDLTAEVTGLGRGDTYDGYLLAHADAGNGDQEIAVDLLSFEGDGEIRREGGVDGVYTPDGSTVTWTVDVPSAGFYNVRLDYLTVPSRGVDMERELYINGELPFSGAATLTFSRLWTDAGEVRKDNQGNDVRPSQVERFDWQRVYCGDDMGYVVEPYRFYFNAGENTLSLKAVNEPMILGAIALTPVWQARTYEEYRAAQPEAAMTDEAKAWQLTVQGESALLRSSPSLYARYDRSSPDTKPYSVTNTILNYIGGDAWNKAGQWIEWSFEVPEDGWYNLSVKARQAYQRGAVSTRSLTIDGEVPFDAVEAIAFNYDTSWQIYTLSDEKGEPYRFYLSAGEHRVRLEASLGEMGPIL